MAKERYGNGYKGGAHTPRKMYTTFRGFADHSARSLKPVHKRKGARRAMRNTIDQTVRCSAEGAPKPSLEGLES